MRARGQIAAWAVAVMSAGCALDRGGSGDPTDAGAIARDAAPDAPIAVDASDDAGSGASSDAGRPPHALCGDDPDLVVCYPFDGDADDHGPRGNHLVASDVTYERSGVVLTDASSLVREHRPGLSHPRTTILAWVRVDRMPTTGRATIVDHDGQYGIFVHPGGELRCVVGTAGSGVAIAPDALRERRWEHVACVAEGTTLRLYVDGDEAATSTAGPARIEGMSALHVGENSPDGLDQLIGAIDDLRIYDAEWTEDQVEDDARRGR